MQGRYPPSGPCAAKKSARKCILFSPVLRGQVLFGRSAGGSFSEAKKNSMRRMVQMAVAIAAVVASTQTEEGGPCAGTHGPQVRSRAPTHRLSYAACACGVRRSAQGARGRLLHSGRAAWSDVPPRQRLSRPPTARGARWPSGLQSGAWASCGTMQPYSLSEASPKRRTRCRYTIQAEPQIFNIVDPGTSIQCTWNPEEKRVCQGVSGRCETHDEL